MAYQTYRLKDGSKSLRRRLARMARDVNMVWNYCNDAQRHAYRHNRAGYGAFELNSLVAGTSRLTDVNAQSIQAVCQRYDANRAVARKRWLRYRGARSLGWIPFKSKGFKILDGAVVYFGRRYKCWVHRPLPLGAIVRVGSFSQDAAGAWYVNIVMQVPDAAPREHGDDVGVDFGLKNVATTSDGHKLPNGRFYAVAEPGIIRAQRANKKRWISRAYVRIARRRRDYLHKASAILARRARLVCMGDAAPSELAKTKMARSLHDAGWGYYRDMLTHKAIARGGMAIRVAERGTSRLCSDCGAVSGPKGIAEIGIREWTCSSCGALHDRDVNAARNILRRGLATLVEGAPPFEGSSHSEQPPILEAMSHGE